jgi:hypothetical protein
MIMDGIHLLIWQCHKNSQSRRNSKKALRRAAKFSPREWRFGLVVATGAMSIMERCGSRSERLFELVASNENPNGPYGRLVRGMRHQSAVQVAMRTLESP